MLFLAFKKKNPLFVIYNLDFHKLQANYVYHTENKIQIENTNINKIQRERTTFIQT